VIQNADGDACDICTAWDEVIVSITGADERYPSYNEALNAGWVIRTAAVWRNG